MKQPHERGVRQTFPQPSPEVTETARAIVRANRGSGRRLQIQQTSDFRTLAIEQLAKHLATATIGYEMGISFDAARKYVGPHSRVGEMWQVAAQFILDCQAADNSATPGPELVGAGQAPGGNAA